MVAAAAAECMQAAIRHGSADGIARSDLVSDLSPAVAAALAAVERRAATAQGASGNSNNDDSSNRGSGLAGPPNVGWKDTARESKDLSLTALGAALKVLLLLVNPAGGGTFTGSVSDTAGSASTSKAPGTSNTTSHTAAPSATESMTSTSLSGPPFLRGGMGGVLQGTQQQQQQQEGQQKDCVLPAQAAALKEAGNTEYTQRR
jgi:hypothetical protein